MKYIFETYIRNLQRKNCLRCVIDDGRKIIHWLIEHRTMLLLGLLSTALYFELYVYNADIVALAEQSRSGHRINALAPIGIAIVFSVVHGLFTAQFWDALGVKAKSA